MTTRVLPLVLFAVALSAACSPRMAASAAQRLLEPVAVRVTGVEPGQPATIGAESGVTSRYVAVRGLVRAEVSVAVVRDGVAAEVLSLSYRGNYRPHAWELVVIEADGADWLDVREAEYATAASAMGLPPAPADREESVTAPLPRPTARVTRVRLPDRD